MKTLEERVELLEKATGMWEEPKKIGIGKWYFIEHLIKEKFPKDALVFCGTTGSLGNFGFNHLGEWIDGLKRSYGIDAMVKAGAKIREAKRSLEVLSALCEEATRRGLRSGVPIVDATGKDGKIGQGIYSFIDNTLWLSESVIMKDGIWAEPRYTYKVGDFVKVINNGKTFPTHPDRPKLGFTKKDTPDFSNGTVGKVFNVGFVNLGSEVVCIRTITGEESLIGVEGVKMYDKFEDLKRAHKEGHMIQVFSELCGDIWVDCDEENPPKWFEGKDYRLKPVYRLGKKQSRVILDDKGLEVCQFNEKNKHLAESVVEFLNR